MGCTARRLLVLAHTAAALGWLGVDLVLAVLTITALISSDLNQVAAVYLTLDVFAVPLLLALGLTTLVTGIVLSLAAGWGLLRWWWIAAKLAITIVLTVLVAVLLEPRITHAAAQSLAADASLLERLGHVRTDLVFPAFVSGAALIGASLIATFKPWGRIREPRTTNSAPQP